MKVESTLTVIAGAAAGGLIAARSASAAPAFRVWRRKVLGSMPASTGLLVAGFQPGRIHR
jgi:hypothetical protein